MNSPAQEPAPVFVAIFDGCQPVEFDTLQDAMRFAETVDAATGTIRYDGLAVIRYDGGNVDLAAAMSR
jgi:hypothetical protein